MAETPDVRHCFARFLSADEAEYMARLAEFDHWLAAHDAQIKAEAWDEGAKYGTYRTNRGEAVIYDIDNPHRTQRTNPNELEEP